MAIDEAGLADLAMDFSKLMEGSGKQLRALLNEIPIEKGRSAEFYEGGLEMIVAISQFLEKELERGQPGFPSKAAFKAAFDYRDDLPEIIEDVLRDAHAAYPRFDSRFVMMIVGAFSARCAELLIDARLRGAC